jgi:hypothetical protein
MPDHRRALWRIEFRTKLTQADSLVIPVAYLLDAQWKEGSVRWLGLLFRKRLTPAELDEVNTATWPELTEIEPFMKRLFEEAWRMVDDAATDLGAAGLAARYSHYSSLLFARAGEGPEKIMDEPVKAFSQLYDHMLGLREKLAPVVKAPVIPLLRSRKATAPVAARPDVALLNEAA